LVKVDSSKCTGCGLCADDCLLKEIKMIDGKCSPKNKICYNCGHCIAICPENAISPLDDAEAEEIIPMTAEDCFVDTDRFINLMKFRRTIRHYKKDPVSREVLEKVLEAGRFSPTGTNSQELRFVVIRDGLKKLTEMSLIAIADMAEVVIADKSSSKIMLAYADMWKRMKADYFDKGIDGMFYGAPAFVAVIANTKYNKLTPPLDSGIACANMEIAARTMGLGTCYVGFLKRATLQDAKINDFIGVKADEEFMTGFSIGYPAVEYFRTVYRKRDKTTWL